jgi:hypothetical protein
MSRPVLRAAVIAVPFDPDQAWGTKAAYRVGGTINGKQVRGTIALDGYGWAFTLTPLDRRHHPAAGPARGVYRGGRRAARRRGEAMAPIVSWPCPCSF